MIKFSHSEIKNNFHEHFVRKMKEEDFLLFFYDIFSSGTAYVVGGFFRDFLNKKESRDIDIIVDVSNEILLTTIKKLGFDFTINRQGGIKVKLKNIEADIWSIENNWAFKNKLVKLNEDDKLNSIAKGCFYNYDSLVINLNRFNYNLRFYKDFLQMRELDILQDRVVYKHLNPSVEANILRAFFIKHNLGIKYSSNTSQYLYSKIGHLQDKYFDSTKRLIDVREKYPKYNILTDELIIYYINDVKKIFYSPNPRLFDIND